MYLRKEENKVSPIAISALILATLALGVLAKPYRNDQRCTDAQTGRELYIGDAFTRPGQCVRVQCLVSLQLWEDSCQVPQLRGNCTRMPAANEYLDYPKCCPLYECRTHQTTAKGEAEETRTYDQYGMLRKTHITQVFVITDPLRENMPGSGVVTQFEI